MAQKYRYIRVKKQQFYAVKNNNYMDCFVIAIKVLVIRDYKGFFVDSGILRNIL